MFRQQQNIKVINVFLIFLVLFSFHLTFIFTEKAEANAVKIHSQFQVSPGVNYRDERMLVSARNQATRVMELNLNDPFTKVHLGVPSPLTNLLTTTGYARRDNQVNNHVVGAINGSFFHLNNRLPGYLLVSNNQILNLGSVSSDNKDYMHVPAAFGVKKDGKAIVDRYSLQPVASTNGKNVSITAFNKVARGTNEVIVYTPTHRYESSRANEFGYEIVVKSTNKKIDHDLKFGEELIGKVQGIRNYGVVQSPAIPQDGFVISGHGTSLNSFVKDLKVGDEIKLTINVEEKWQDADFMLASGPLLVQNGAVDMTIDESSNRATERHPRTAVAVNKAGDRVFFVTVDGRQTGYSEGMTLKEFANYLVSLGAHQAINLDGGGSTTMAARFHGQQFATIANRPSGGSERLVSAVLQAISTAPIGQPKFMVLNRSASETTVVGTSLDIRPNYVLDQYFNALPIDLTQLKVTVEGNIGRVEGTKFFAERIGTGRLHISYGSIVNTINVTVDKIEKLVFEPDTKLIIGPNKTQPIVVHALDKAGKKMAINQDVIRWAVSDGVGTVNQQSIFASGTKLGNGTITATVGDTKASLQVEIRERPLVIETFESTSNWNAQSIRAAATLAKSKGDEPVKVGASSAKLNYNMTVGEEGTAAAYLVANQLLPIQGYPDHLGVWVYGNAKHNWLRGVVVDGTGKQHTINFTSEGGLDWVGWKYVTATLPTNLPLPLRFERIYVVEAVKARQNKGVLYFDELQAVYSPAYKQPYFTVSPNVQVAQVSSDKTWTITYNTKLLPQSVNSTNLYVIDQYGNKASTAVSLDETGTIVKIVAPPQGYKTNSNYQLVLTTGILSDKRVPMAKDVTKIFSVK